jgi:hypothetical protein
MLHLIQMKKQQTQWMAGSSWVGLLKSEVKAAARLSAGIYFFLDGHWNFLY